jgi:hypothetical protein
MTIPYQIVSQLLGGDTNDNPEDGNPVANGEYGEYCSAPAAAAMSIKLWFNKGYTYLLREGSSVLTDAQLMDRLFTSMNIAENLGAYDEEVVAGLRAYIISHGSQLKVDTRRQPKINDLFGWMGDCEYSVMVGLSGNPGLWLTAAGVTGMTDENGYYTLRMADPITGVIGQHDVKEETGKLWMDYDGSWHEVDILVGLIPVDWTVSRSAIGVDAISGDGWSFDWEAPSLSQDSLYFVHAVATDQDGKQGSASVLVQYDCTVNGIIGDVNHDGEVNSADIVYLGNYLYLNGPPPPGDYTAADINCDQSLDLADLIYLYNYLFNGGPVPCP